MAMVTLISIAYIQDQILREKNEYYMEMEIDLFCIHNIEDFPPSACSCLGRCTTGACAEDGGAF